MPNKKYPSVVFKERIKSIREELENYCNETVDLYRKATSLFEKYDQKKADEVIERSKEMDIYGYEIERSCIRFIAVEQPLATDLLYVESSIRVMSHIKRIAYLCRNMAEASNEIKDITVPEQLKSDVQFMIDYVQIMLTKGFRAFVNQDITIARELSNDDDKVDDLFDSILKQITQLVAKKEDFALGVINLLFLTRYLERIGDRVVQIGDRIVFINTNRRPRIEQLKEEN